MCVHSYEMNEFGVWVSARAYAYVWHNVCVLVTWMHCYLFASISFSFHFQFKSVVAVIVVICRHTLTHKANRWWIPKNGDTQKEKERETNYCVGCYNITYHSNHRRLHICELNQLTFMPLQIVVNLSSKFVSSAHTPNPVIDERRWDQVIRSKFLLVFLLLVTTEFQHLCLFLFYRGDLMYTRFVCYSKCLRVRECEWLFHTQTHAVETSCHARRIKRKSVECSITAHNKQLISNNKNTHTLSLSLRTQRHTHQISWMKYK